MVELLFTGLLSLAISLGLLIGAVLGWVAFFNTRRLTERLARLEAELAALRGVAPVAPAPGATPLTPLATPGPRAPPHGSRSREPTPGEPAAEVPPPLPPPLFPPPSPELARVFEVSRDPAPLATPPWLTHLQTHWMVWLGALCLGLAGIFLVKYSIDQGLLGPVARIVIALALGLSFHAGAEILRRRTGEPHPAFAGLAAGGSITLFAALLAALYLYQLLSPNTAFVLLALVAVSTQWLALRHGPILAAMGILGAYIVPLLVGGDGSSVVVLIYSLIISASALVLMGYVFRPWLWLGVLVGALGWWSLTLGLAEADGVRGLYLTLLAYGLVAIPRRDGWLGRRVTLATLPPAPWGWPRALATLEAPYERWLPVGLVAIVIAQGISIVGHGFAFDHALIQWTPLVLLILAASQRLESLYPLPWLLLGVQWLAWLLSDIEIDPVRDTAVLVGLPPAAHWGFYGYSALMAGVYGLLASYGAATQRFKGVWWSLATTAPLLWLTLAYLLTTDQTPDLAWSAIALLVGVGYLIMARLRLAEGSRDMAGVWLLLAAHLAYSLAAAMGLQEASLTLALAAQLISLAWLIQRLDLPALGWLLKGVVTVVVVRLTLNPGLATYPDTLHWSLWTYGGATLCCTTASQLLKGRYLPLARWTQGAALHLLVLTVWSETRYWLYDGQVFAQRFAAVEAALNVAFGGALALVYQWRAKLSSGMATLYQLASRIVMVLALLNYLILLGAVLASDPWLVEAIDPAPVWNLLLLAFGVPVVLGLLTQRLYPPWARGSAMVFTGLAAFVWVSLEVRHLWQGTIDFGLPTPSGELYSYSAVWLVMAIMAILGGTWRFGQGCYRAGMALLALVIAKLFLVDLSDLQGLLRVASFMGLGLGLLGVAYLHQRLQALRVKGA
ncbi:MAG: DUF2339 domain-containing protein [Candidatus Competibacterales bacterium]